jgi:hypothetical protein
VDTFFIPVGPDGDEEGTYQRLRLQTQLRMGRAPSHRRIRELWTRRGSLDCTTTVGEPDPICGEVVIAIFDMGPNRPFVVYCQDSSDPEATACEVLGPSAYTVSEFVL